MFEPRNDLPLYIILWVHFVLGWLNDWSTWLWILLWRFFVTSRYIRSTKRQIFLLLYSQINCLDNLLLFLQENVIWNRDLLFRKTSFSPSTDGYHVLNFVSIAKSSRLDCAWYNGFNKYIWNNFDVLGEQSFSVWASQIFLAQKWLFWEP